MGHGIAGGYSATNISLDTTGRPLDRIAADADRVERLAYAVEQFGDRFYSGPSTINGGTGSSAVREVPVGYKGQLDRLNEATDRLDKAVQRLTEIG